MKHHLWVLVLVGLATADVAAAGGATAPVRARAQIHHGSVVAISHTSYRPPSKAHARKARRLRRVNAHVTTASSRVRPDSTRQRTLAELQETPDGAPHQPGWFKTHDEAGWGFTQGRTETMVGLYKRPEQPDLPGPQIYHQPETRGAAGVSISLKLGH